MNSSYPNNNQQPTYQNQQVSLIDSFATRVNQLTGIQLNPNPRAMEGVFYTL